MQVKKCPEQEIFLPIFPRSENLKFVLSHSYQYREEVEGLSPVLRLRMWYGTDAAALSDQHQIQGLTEAQSTKGDEFRDSRV